MTAISSMRDNNACFDDAAPRTPEDEDGNTEGNKPFPVIFIVHVA
jgi:hypothetical protein